MNVPDRLSGEAPASAPADALAPATEVRAGPVRSPHRPELLAAVAQIADVLAACADDGEENGRLAPSSVAALRASGLFAALAPHEVGGFQVDPVTELELIEAVSAIDPSTGWAFWAAAGSTARIASMLPQPAVAEIFDDHRDHRSHPDRWDRFALFAFQERPFGNVACPTEAGLRVTGTWPFATTVDFADWVAAVATLEPTTPIPASAGIDPGGDQLVAAAIPSSQIAVLPHSWDSAGLRGTGTFAYQVQDVVVPWHRVWAYPPSAPLRGGPFFGFRRAPIKHTGWALGVTRGFLTGFREHVAARTASGRPAPDGLLPDLARAQLRLDAARTLAIAAVEQVWDQALTHGSIPPAAQARLRAVARQATETAHEVCGLLNRYGDASLLGRRNPLHRALRDLAAGSAHAEVSTSALDDYGATLLPTPTGPQPEGPPSTVQGRPAPGVPRTNVTTGTNGTTERGT